MKIKESFLIMLIIQAVFIWGLIFLQIKQAEMIWQLVEYNSVMKQKLNLELNEFRQGLFVGIKWEDGK